MDEPETANSDRLVEALKEIRDELRALRGELGGRMTTSGIRTEVVDRGARWRNAALAGGGLAVLAIVLGLAMRDRPAPATFEAAPAIATAPATATAPAKMPAPPVMPAPAPVVAAAPVAAPLPVAKSGTPARPPAAAPTPATRQPARLPAGAPAIAGVPVPTKKRVKPDVAAKLPSEVASDADEPIAFAPPAKRVRVHRMSYGPVESEPAKL
jgi:hypothetical protein